jgi:hypothetical protein
VSFRPESTLNPRALRREAGQLGVVVAVSVAALLLEWRVAQVVVGIVDLIAGAFTAIAAVVAWRAGGRAAALGLYALAAALFLVLAVANLF